MVHILNLFFRVLSVRFCLSLTRNSLDVSSLGDGIRRVSSVAAVSGGARLFMFSIPGSG